MKIEIPKLFIPIAQKISQTAKENGFQTYIVGGFVRDLILKKEPKDMDIMAENLSGSNNAKSAGIELAKILSQKYNLRQPVIFEKFGTAKLAIDGQEIEFVMPRIEYYQDDSRNPQTQIGTLQQDALRRDFTVNALFLRLSDMKLLDLTKNGIEDIKREVLRATDTKNAEIIFSQDPLRILRALRFSGQLGFSIEAKTFAAMKNTVSRISIVSPERIRDEINKILVLDKPSKVFAKMDKIGLLEILFPEIKKLQDLKQPEKSRFENAYKHTMSVLDKTEPFLSLRMASLFCNIGKTKTQNEKGKKSKNSSYSYEIKSAEIAQRILEELKFSKDFIEQVVLIIENYTRPLDYNSSWGDGAIRRLAFNCGQNIDFIMNLAKANIGKSNPKIKLDELAERIEKLKIKNELETEKNFISGEFLMKHFNLGPGQWIKTAKSQIIDALIENPKLTKEEAFEIVKEFLIREKLIS
jgi:tRNA nucleotidyltransferase/poly(A) polymerase